MHRIVDATPMSTMDRDRVDAYWRAANYLSVGQIYLMDNPLLREPLHVAHVEPRLLGHWGTTPGLNFLYAHLNRIIVQRGQPMIYVAGPGHGGPGWSPTPGWREPTPRCTRTWEPTRPG